MIFTRKEKKKKHKKSFQAPLLSKMPDYYLYFKAF